MQIQISGQHIQVTPALRERVETQIGRFERLFDNITGLDVVLSVDKNEHKASGTLHCAGTRLHAEYVDGTNVKDVMYTAIDAMIAKLADQLKKHKEKLKDHHNEEGREARHASEAS